VLAFFDEINATVNNNHVYGTFLDPIDRGTYTRGGRTFYIRPCTWIFAGTGMGESEPETKGSDFKSRLTHPPLSFSSTSDLLLAKLERVYIGAAFLVNTYTDVTHASDLVLESFRLLNPDTSLRDQERFVGKFRHFHKNTVWGGSVPLELIDQSCDEAGAAIERHAARHDDKHAMKRFDRQLAAYRKARKQWSDRLKSRKETAVRIVSKSVSHLTEGHV
jgi:hypothetical protein